MHLCRSAGGGRDWALDCFPAIASAAQAARSPTDVCTIAGRRCAYALDYRAVIYPWSRQRLQPCQSPLPTYDDSRVVHQTCLNCAT